MTTRDIILTVNIVEPALVDAVHKFSKELGHELKGVVLIDKTYAKNAAERDFYRDKTGLFTEIFCDFNDEDELQKTIQPYTDRLLAATCRSETAIYHFRKLIPFIPYLSTPSETSIVWSTEKPLMRDRLSNYDRSLTPKYQYMEATDISNTEVLMKDFVFPVIIKPGGLADSLLVTRCETLADLKENLYNTFNRIDEVYAVLHRALTPSVLVEEFMQGDMYSTDAYVTSEGEIFCLPLVKVITAESIGLPGYYSYRHIIPVDLSQNEVDEAFKVARASIRALNLRSTTTHIELFYTPNGWKIIELGARIGGYRHGLYKEAYGVDHFYNDLLIHTGRKPIMPDEVVQHAAGFNIYADEEGIIESIEGIEESQKLESVVFIAPHAEPGDEALFANNGGRLIVDGILRNKDPQKLEEDMAKIRELVKINVRPKRTNNLPHKKAFATSSH